MHAILHARVAPLSLYRNSPPWIFHNLISYKALAIIILQLLCFNATFRFPILFMPRFRFPILFMRRFRFPTLFMSRFCFPILFMPRSVVSSFPTTLHAIIHHLMHCLPALHHAKQRSLVTATSFSNNSCHYASSQFHNLAWTSHNVIVFPPCEIDVKITFTRFGSLPNVDGIVPN